MLRSRLKQLQLNVVLGAARVGLETLADASHLRVYDARDVVVAILGQRRQERVQGGKPIRDASHLIRFEGLSRIVVPRFRVQRLVV